MSSRAWRFGITSLAWALLSAGVRADYLVLSRSATIRSLASSTSTVVGNVAEGDILVLAASELSERWYKVHRPDAVGTGWVYQTMARRYAGDPPGSGPAGPDAGETVTVCSFNIKFLGTYDQKQNDALAGLLAPFDMVVIQELTGAPGPGMFPDGTPYVVNDNAQAFADAMAARGFLYVLSPEDTGPGTTLHGGTSHTEWFITFYKSAMLAPAADLPNTFLADDRSQHPVYRRVPYAASFRTLDGNLDFTLINVHLHPGSGKKPERKAELEAIGDWVADHAGSETDVFILGDMNIEHVAELNDAAPEGWESLNDQCAKTNTASTSKPYDHVLCRADALDVVDTAYDFQVLDLIDAMRGLWPGAAGSYPGDPYSTSVFPPYYSDHHPVAWRMTIGAEDDDG
jgi:hypothetical protein